MGPKDCGFARGIVEGVGGGRLRIEMGFYRPYERWSDREMRQVRMGPVWQLLGREEGRSK